jgi:hypothetical protein
MQDLGFEWHKVGMVLKPEEVRLAPFAARVKALEASVPGRLSRAADWSTLFEPDALIDYVLYVLGKARGRHNFRYHRDLLLSVCTTSARARTNPMWV